MNRLYNVIPECYGGSRVDPKQNGRTKKKKKKTDELGFPDRRIESIGGTCMFGESGENRRRKNDETRDGFLGFKNENLL